eukprot:Gregarina_sp_Poly_1__10701@NODE_80_length_15637_cov_125_963134_g68_i0_p5_GENE_NODE_80_length_15637_cov_125_963134_g68_i0NODE_80_length_15637_cov_125_963134_g68_i0_p5_ORF_typecomplete_len387_score52_60DNA_pol_D_N/PF18018_1/0_047SLT_L/PF14718_6/0_23_NODE_80_length_15637_cov_125_963134_g68_i042475407
MSNAAIDDLISIFESQLEVKLTLDGAQAILQWLSQFSDVDTQTNLLRFLETLDEVVTGEELEGVEEVDVALVHAALDVLTSADSTEDVVQHQSLPATSAEPLCNPIGAEESQNDDGVDENQLSLFAEELASRTRLVDLYTCAQEHGSQLPWFDVGTQRWIKRPTRPSIIPKVESQAMMFQQRFFLALERTKALPNVKWWTRVSGTESYNYYDGDIILRSVEQARGLSGAQYIIGILRLQQNVNMEDGSREWSWLLEDTSAQIKLNLSNYSRNNDFLLNGNIVVAYGTMAEDCLEVLEIALPWIDLQNTSSCRLTTLVNSLGAATEQTVINRLEEGLASLLECDSTINSQRQIWVLINEAHLDDAETVDRLRSLFQCRLQILFLFLL